MVVFDTTFLVHLVDPSALAPIDPKTGERVTHPNRRIQHLIGELNKSRTKIIIPTPALAELLIVAEDAGSAYLDRFSRAAVFQVEAFDIRAAVEHALMTGNALKAGDRRAGSTASAAKIKFDRQIVAIAKANQSALIYSDDENLTKFAQANDIEVKAIWDLPLPPQDAQMDLLTSIGMAEAPETEAGDDDQEEENS